MIPSELSGARVAVTGGAGFIGSHLVRALMDVGARVTALTPEPPRRVLPRQEDGSRLEVRLVDPLAPATSTRELQETLAGAQAVVHLAYRPPSDTGADAVHHETTYNLGGLRRLLDGLPGSVRHVVFASSVVVYGNDPPVPVNEDEEARPVTSYGRAKLLAERLLRDWAEDRDVITSILRLATVYGPDETSPRAIPNFIRATLAGRPPSIDGAGDDVRDYVHVSDVVRGILLALARRPRSPDTFNLAAGTGWNTREVAELVVRLAGGGPPPVHIPADRRATRLVCDVTRAAEALGYSPAVDLPDGVLDEFAWFARRPWLWEHDGAPELAHTVDHRSNP